ncbi:cbb3-type cytochrome c oxidase subunit 3 [Rappaport israeli]|uniref:cbb3-type cytochrome c oxidase subunit 3 n=1 Tax=Rappaport israeli TaxID=1839807 RepID=UPI00092FE17C|nr:cbb3-type cytochrome c oxidase subunit 3 [Rappaport israeli]
MSAWAFATIVLFTSFVLLCVVLFLPSRNQAYKDADKLALKDEQEIITPRHKKLHHDEETKL